MPSWLCGLQSLHADTVAGCRIADDAQDRHNDSAPNQSIEDANLCDRCANLRRMELFAFADIPSLVSGLQRQPGSLSEVPQP